MGNVIGATLPVSTIEEFSIAIENSVDGDVIELASGTYLVPAAPTVDTPTWRIEKGITIKSQSGNREDVVFRPSGNGQDKYLFYLDHENARIESITLDGIKTRVRYQLRESGTFNVVQGGVSNCAIYNSSFQYVGAIALKSAKASAYDCEIKNCSASDSLDQGAGIYLSGNAFVSGCHVEGNEARQGAALFIGSGNPCVTNCTFIKNRVKNTGRGGGGAVYINGGNPTLASLVISQNTAVGGSVSGTGLYMAGGTIRNSLISGNTDDIGPGAGGGVYLSGGTIENCTIVGNYKSLGSANGVYQKGGTIRNSIIAYNSTDGTPFSEGNHVKTAGTVTYTMTYPEQVGDGNRSDDPGFIEPGTNWHLGDASELFDAGVLQPWMEGATDLLGNPRVQNDAVNLGCYEDATPLVRPLGVSFLATAVSGAKPLNVTFTPNVKFAPSENITYAWDFGDGTTSSEANPQKTYDTYGVFTVSLTVACEGLTASYTFPSQISVGSSCVYLNHTGDAIWPFDEPQKGTTNIEDAFSALFPPVEGKATMMVGSGTYYPQKRIDIIDIPVEMRGDNAIFDAKDFSATEHNRGILFVNNADSVVSGIILTGGSGTDALGDKVGSALSLRSGLVENMVVSNNTCNGYLCTCVYITGGTFTSGKIYGCTSVDSGAGGGGRAAYILEGSNARLEKTTIQNCSSYAPGQIKNGIVTECVFTNNTSKGAGFQVASGATISNSSFINNTNSENGYNASNAIISGEGTLRNCLIAQNYTKCNSILRFGGKIENCTIADNYQTVDKDGFTGVVLTSSATMQNSIIVGNVNFQKVENNISASEGSVNVANFFTNPKFVNSAIGNYRLRRKSPARDAADLLSWMEGGTDLDGKSRIFGKAPDLGCYECDLPLPLGIFVK